MSLAVWAMRSVNGSLAKNALTVSSYHKLWSPSLYSRRLKPRRRRRVRRDNLVRLFDMRCYVASRAKFNRVLGLSYLDSVPNGKLKNRGVDSQSLSFWRLENLF